MKDLKIPIPNKIGDYEVIISSDFQLGNFLDALVDAVGTAKLTASTFGNGQEFLLKLLAHKKRGTITEATLLCDTRASEKNSRMKTLMHNAYDKILYGKNHSKLLILEPPEDYPICVISSQNQTRGYLLEAYVIIRCPDVIARLKRTLLECAAPDENKKIPEH